MAESHELQRRNYAEAAHLVGHLGHAFCRLFVLVESLLYWFGFKPHLVAKMRILLESLDEVGGELGVVVMRTPQAKQHLELRFRRFVGMGGDAHSQHGGNDKNELFHSHVFL